MADQPAAGVTLAERYEQLRQVALGGHAEGWRHGLGVLIGRGMAAWMQAWTPTGHLPAPAPVRSNTGPLPAGSVRGTPTAQVVAVLASMTLAHT